MREGISPGGMLGGGCMWMIPNEDEYWERVREEREAPSKYAEPYLEEETLFLDEEIEEIERKYGCSMEELYEGDLEDIVQEMRGIVPESARYDSSFECIVYKFYEEAQYA